MRILILLLLLTSCAKNTPEIRKLTAEIPPTKGWVYEVQDDVVYILRTYTVGRDSCRYGNMYKIVKQEPVGDIVTTTLDSTFYTSCHLPAHLTQHIKLNCKYGEYAIDDTVMQSVNTSNYALVKLFNQLCTYKFGPLSEPDIPSKLTGDGFIH